MREALRYLSCLFLVILSTTALAQNSYTARIPAAIAVGEFAEAEMLIAEGIKIGAIKALAAESYRASIQRAREKPMARQQGKRQQTTNADPEQETIPRQSSHRKPEPRDPPLPPLPGQPDNPPRERRGRIYVTYIKLNNKTKLYYSGRTSMAIELDTPLDVQAQQAIDQRNLNHHLDETPEPTGPTFGPDSIDKYDWGTAIDYQRRYGDKAYLRIRGREQMLIDYFGGAQSDTGEPYRAENKIRGVAKDNKDGKLFYEAAKAYWGNKIGDKEINYTGY